jgi:hypothetical protein
MKNIPPNLESLDYSVFYSEEDKEYVATCKQFPSLSWLDEDELKALEGLKNIINDYLWEEYSFIRPNNCKIDFSRVKSPKG